MNLRREDRAYTDPASPPECGPYAKPKWDSARQHWRRVLNDAGQQYVTQEITQHSHYPLGCGQVLSGLFPRLFESLHVALRLNRLTIPDARSAAEYGLVLGAIRYDPSRGTAFTSSVLRMREKLVELITQVTNREHGIPIVDDESSLTDIFCDRQRCPAEHAQIEELRQSVAQCISAASLSPIEQQALSMIVYEQLSLSDVAAALGTTKIKVRQIFARAMAKIEDHILEKIDYHP